jgi:hypothetical protein
MPGYLLLRSNKESGPFALQELISLGLKPYDLVWVEGKSAAWRYPGEIAELKPYALVVEEQPYDRFYKKGNRTVDVYEDDIPEKNIKKLDVNATEALVNYIRTPQTAGKQVPDANSRKRVFVTLPAGLQLEGTTKPIMEVMVAPPVKTAVAANKIPILPTPEATHLKNTVSESVVLEEKYSMPLDDIKQLYIDNMLKQKTKKGVRFNLGSNLVMLVGVSAFFAVVIVAGTLISERNDKISALVPPAVEQNALIQQVADETDAGNPAPEKETSKKDAIIQLTKKNVPHRQDDRLIASQSEPTKSAVKNNKSAQKPIENSNVPVVISIASHNEAATVSGNAATAALPTLTNAEKTELEPAKTTSNNPTKETVVQASYPATPDPEKTSTKKKIKKLVVVDKIDYKTGLLGGVKNVSVSLSNHSNFKMDLVIVDVDYLKANDNTIKTERLYFKNLLPDAAVTLAAPAGQGSKIDCRITLISSKELDYLYATIN